MNRLKKYSPLLLAIQSVDPKTRVGILRSAPDEFIKTLLEIIVNFLAGNVVRSTTSHKPLHVRRLTRYKSLLRRLCAQRNVKKTRKVLVQQKGGFLPFLIAPLILAGTAATAAAVAPVIARKVSANAAEGAVDAALNKVEDRVTGYINKL